MIFFFARFLSVLLTSNKPSRKNCKTEAPSFILSEKGTRDRGVERARRRASLCGERGDVVVVWYRCVSLGVGIVVVAGLPSRAGTCPQWCRALSMIPAKSHSARAEGFGRTARAMAALRRRRAIWISFPPAMKGFRRQMLPVPTGGNVCCVLKRSSDGLMRPAVRGPHKRAEVNTLLPQFSDFISVIRKFTIECRLCSISVGCSCNGGGHAHVQGRTASGDSSSSKNTNQPRLRSSEPPGFRCSSGVCPVSRRRLQHEHTRCAPAWLRRCCRFLRVPTVGQGKNCSIGTGHLPPRLCYRVFSERW